MNSLQERLRAANAQLIPEAVPHEGRKGRTFPEPEDETRFPFQRDRGRITHTQAFRRLQGKTQVFVAGDGDHYRTRLTHTMEVSQIARDIARTIGLNEDLTECIALAHDLGHPPFGHAGEDALNEWMQGHHSKFEHNDQSLRIVALLEDHSTLYQGLNLNLEIVEGLQKKRGHLPTLEARVVDHADAIAYSAHDSEDGIRAGLFTSNDLSHVPLIAKARVMTDERGTSLRGAIIHFLTEDLYDRAPDVSFSEAMQTSLHELHDFLAKRMYQHPDVSSRNADGRTIVLQLCETLFNNPTEKVLELQKKFECSLVEAVKDYIAGMTDRFATNYHLVDYHLVDYQGSTCIVLGRYVSGSTA